MSAPKTDEAGIRQTIRALRAADYVLVSVFDGDDDGPVKVTTEQEAVAAITAVDDAYLYVRPKDADETDAVWVRFVLGNDPEEVICDHLVSLSHVLDPLMERWG